MTAAPALTDAQMYERVLSAILDHRLPPGTKLVEDRLARLLATLVFAPPAQEAHDLAGMLGQPGAWP